MKKAAEGMVFMEQQETWKAFIARCASVRDQVRMMIEQKEIQETPKLKQALDALAYVINQDRDQDDSYLRSRGDSALRTIESELRKQKAFERPFDTDDKQKLAA